MSHATSTTYLRCWTDGVLRTAELIDYDFPTVAIIQKCPSTPFLFRHVKFNRLIKNQNNK